MRFLSPETTVLAIANILINRSWGSANDHGINHQQKGHQKFRRRRNKETGAGRREGSGGKERRRERGRLAASI